MSYAQLQPPFNTSYTLTDLGQPSGVPFPYGAMTFLDANTLLLVGCDEDFCGASVPAEAAYKVNVVRDGSGHITGFSGVAAVLASSLNHVEAGMGFGPGGVLFYNDLVGLLGEIKPGSSTTDKMVDLLAAGACGPYVSGLEFAPNGDLKVADYGCGTMYTVALTPDGTGTYNIASVTQTGGLEPFVENFSYVPAGSTGFAGPSLLATNWVNSSVNVYSVDGNYNSTSEVQTFANITRAFGSTVDPTTNDLLISSWEYGTAGHVYLASGFAPPPGHGAVQFSPASLNAKSVVVGTSGAAQTVTLTNSGAGPLKINQITASGNYSETDTCVNAILAPTGTCTIQVTFAPTVAGTIPGAITVDDDASGSPSALAITGKGVYPVTATPASASFGSVTVGTSGSAKTVTVTNNTGSSVNFTFAASPDFSAVASGTKPCNGFLAAKAKCTISANFAPTFNGPIQGSLAISGATFPTQVVNLNGTGTGGGSSPLTFTPASLSFSATVMGTASSSKLLTVKNSSASTVSITNFVASAGFSVIGTGGTPCGGALGAGASCTVSVTFGPPIATTLKGGVSFMGNGAVGTQIVPVSGKGVLTASFAPTKLAFSAQAVGTTSAPKVLTITNNQGVILNLLGMVASGNYGVAPGGTKPCTTSLPANAKCTVQVTFRPSHTGVIAGAVTLSHDAPGSPQVIGLSGTGQ